LPLRLSSISHYGFIAAAAVYLRRSLASRHYADVYYFFAIAAAQHAETYAMMLD